MVDAIGTPLRVHLTAGNVNDIVPACDQIEGLLTDKLLVNRAYDANKLLALAKRQGHEVIIPPIPSRLMQREYDTHAYKEHHLVELFSPTLKWFGSKANLSSLFQKGIVTTARLRYENVVLRYFYIFTQCLC